MAPHRHAKRAWPRHKIIPVKWFNLVGKCSGAGVLDTPFGKFARLQILTIEDLFAGKKPAMPPEDPAAFRKAAREEDKTRQGKLV